MLFKPSAILTQSHLWKISPQFNFTISKLCLILHTILNKFHFVWIDDIKTEWTENKTINLLPQVYE